MVEFKFSIFNEEIRILTDEPTATEKALRMVLGVEDARVGAAGEDGFRPPVLLLAGDYERARAGLSGLKLDSRASLDGVEVEMGGRAAVWLVRLPAKVQLRLRSILHGVAAFARWRLMGRGIYTLHASGVGGGGGAIVFSGGNGSGKTTLATRFVREGWNFLADDNLPLSFENGGLRANFIGESINGMRFDAGDFDSLVERGYKLFGYPGFLTAPAVERAAGVRMIFFLERGEEVKIEKMALAAASMKLLGLCKVPLLGKNDFKKYFDFAMRCAAGTRCAKLRFTPEKAGAETVKKITGYLGGVE